MTEEQRKCSRTSITRTIYSPTPAMQYVCTIKSMFSVFDGVFFLLRKCAIHWDFALPCDHERGRPSLRSPGVGPFKIYFEQVITLPFRILLYRVIIRVWFYIIHGGRRNALERDFQFRVRTHGVAT